MNTPSVAKPVIIRTAVPEDIATILQFIRELAEFERLADLAQGTPEQLHTALFGPRPYCEVLIAELDGQAEGFALFFHNFSTFLAQPGLYLEDLFVRERARGHGLGLKLMQRLAATAVARGCGRFEWSVLDWNEASIKFYRSLGAVAMEEWTVQRLSGEALLKLADAQS